MQADQTQDMNSRVVMALTGALAGFSVWLMSEVLHELISNQHVFLFVVASISGFFGTLLALCGPVSILRAAPAAAGLALVTATLFSWASLRHAEIDPFLEHGYGIVAWLVALSIATPFVAVWLEDRNAWRNYAELFDVTWTIVVRYAAAWLFVAVFWGVVFLSNALFEIVGISIIEDFLDIEGVPYVLSGLTLGLALSVVYELRDYVSPFLILRLMRLLIPVVLVVIAVFIAALPFRGLSGLFGDLSAGGTLMAMAIGGITLITTALDRDDEAAISMRVMRLATQALALLLPVLGVLAFWAVSLRIQQYGWTPNRMAAAAAAALIGVYAFLYAVAVLWQMFGIATKGAGDWMARIRRANVVMALVIVGLSLLWLSPVLNGERISARSQVARYMAGEAKADQLPLWEMAHRWGTAGQDALTTLAAIENEDQKTLTDLIEKAQSTSSIYAYNRASTNTKFSNGIAILRANLTVIPSNIVLGEDVFAEVNYFHGLKDWEWTCKDAVAPGCVLFIADLDSLNTGKEGFIFRPYVPTGSAFIAERITFTNDRVRKSGGYLLNPETRQRMQFSTDEMKQLVAGDYRIAPSSSNSLWLGDVELDP